MTDDPRLHQSPPPRQGPGPDLILAHRVEELERDNRRLRRWGTYILVGVGVLLGLTTAIIVVSARHGMPGMVARVTESQSFLLRDSRGQIRATLNMNEKGAAQLALQDGTGRQRLRLSVLSDGSSGAAFVDSTGASRIVMGLLPDETSTIVLADHAGKTRTVLGLSRNGASTIVFADAGGITRAGMGVDQRGQGTFTMIDRSGAQGQEASDEVAPSSADSVIDSVTPVPVTSPNKQKQRSRP
ncbi:MAG: hypothetical protein ABI766_12415 [Gemmatimonadales bacterium]